MKQAITPKLFLYGIFLVCILIALALDSCTGGPEIVVEVPTEAISPKTMDLIIIGIKDDHTVILSDMKTENTYYMEVENAYSQAYETGLIITLINN